MKLYGDILSPFVRMSMVTALECGLSMRVQLVTTAVKPFEVNKSLEAMSPIGKIPVLHLDDGQSVYDSRVIMEYFCNLAGNSTLLPASGAKRHAVQTTLALVQGIGEACVQLRYETAVRPEAARWAELAARLQARVAAGLDALERMVTTELKDVTLASIGAAVVLTYIDLRKLVPDDWRKTRPALAAWHEEAVKRQSMVHTQPKA